MRFNIENIQTKIDPQIIGGESCLGMKFSFDVILEGIVIGNCNVSIINSIKHTKLADNGGNSFIFKPKKQCFVYIEDIQKIVKPVTRKESQDCSSPGNSDTLTQDDVNKALVNFNREGELAKGNKVGRYSKKRYIPKAIENGFDKVQENLDAEEELLIPNECFSGNKGNMHPTDDVFNKLQRMIDDVQKSSEVKNAASRSKSVDEVYISQENGLLEVLTDEQQVNNNAHNKQSLPIDSLVSPNISEDQINVNNVKGTPNIKIEDYFDFQPSGEEVTAYIDISPLKTNDLECSLDAVQLDEKEIMTNVVVTSSNFQGASAFISKKRRKKDKHCTVCDKSFARKGDLKRHGLIHTNVKPFKCEECGKSFLLKGNLKSHQLLHTGIKPFQCQECGKTFFKKCLLKSHFLNIHSTNVESFSCDECGKSFKKEDSLNIHVRSFHKGIKFQCEDCGKGFSRKSDLRKHENSVHKGIKFQCEDCEKSFSRNSDLRKHENSVHKGIYPFQCSCCQKQFSTKSHFDYHMTRGSCQNENQTCSMVKK